MNPIDSCKNELRKYMYVPGETPEKFYDLVWKICSVDGIMWPDGKTGFRPDKNLADEWGAWWKSVETMDLDRARKICESHGYAVTKLPYEQPKLILEAARLLNLSNMAYKQVVEADLQILSFKDRLSEHDWETFLDEADIDGLIKELEALDKSQSVH